MQQIVQAYTKFWEVATHSYVLAISVGISDMVKNTIYSKCIIELEFLFQIVVGFFFSF